MARILGDRYELGAHLASGGMADVFVAHDHRLDRPVAVKLLRTELTDPTLRMRFEHEALTAARLAHPNIVAVHDVGEAEHRPYLVMELVDGDTLATVLARRGPLPVDEATSIAGDVLAALGAAHARGVVHRDVKPGNVLLAADGTVKLADFGIAKAMADTTGGLTSTGQVVGTPKYLSPEQATGRAATARSDLYATGVVLYEMLAGEPPFAGDSAVAIALAHRQAPVPPLRERRPEVPSPLAAVIERALAKDAEQRPSSAEEMRTALADPASAATLGATLHPSAVATEAVRPDETALLAQPISARRRRRVAPVAIALGAAAALVVALALFLPRDESPGGDAGAGETTTGEATNGDPAVDEPLTSPLPTEPPGTVPATEPPPPEPSEPETVGELVALLAENPDAFGEKGPDLLEDLVELQSEDPDRQGREAARVMREVEQWVDEGELDSAIGALTLRLLGPLADERGRD